MSVFTQFAPTRIPGRQQGVNSECPEGVNPQGGEPKCETDNVALFCNHGVSLKLVTDEGLLVVLFGLVGFSFALLSIAIAHKMDGLVYAVLGVDAVLATTSFLWRIRDQRLTATLQAVGTLTLVGVAALAPLDHAWLGALAAGLGLAIGGLWAAAIDDPQYNLDEIVKLMVAALAAVAFIIGFGFLATSKVTAAILLASGAGLVLFYFGGFLRQAVNRAFRLPLPTKPRIGVPKPIPAPRFEHRAVPPGFLGIFVMFTNRLITAVNGIMSAAAMAINVAVKVVFRILQWIELTLHRITVRAIQVLSAIVGAVRDWVQLTWQLMQHHLFPSFIGVAAFSGAAVSILLADRRIIDYVVSDEGFSATGWLHLMLLGALFVSAIICIAVACASYVTPFVSGLRSMLRNVEATAPYGWFLLSLSVLGAVVGLPVARLIPAVKNLSSAGPYHFGPATLLIVAGLGIVFVIAIRSPVRKAAQSRPEEPTPAPSWVRRLSELIGRAELARLSLPASALALLAAGIVIAPTIPFGNTRVSQVQGSTTPQGIYYATLSTGRSCVIGISGPVATLVGETDCTGLQEACFVSWNVHPAKLELACSAGTKISLALHSDASWSGSLTNAFGGVPLSARRR